MVANVRATDLDFDINGTLGILYTFQEGSDSRFVIDSVTGAILLLRPLIYNMEQNLTLIIIASDQLGIFGCKKTFTSLLVAILPQNLHSPIFNEKEYSVVVDEFTSIGSFLPLTIKAIDADKNLYPYNYGVVAYFLLDTTNVFTINSVTGQFH